MRLLILASLIGVAMASSAAAQPQSADKCFLARLMRSHTVDGKDTIYLNVDGTAVYRLKMDETCIAHATGSDPIVVRDLGSGKICSRQDLDVEVRGLRCFISSLTKLTPAEASALPVRLQP